MSEIVIADNIRQYLLDNGVANVYTDNAPDTPIDLVVVFDSGGLATAGQAPESYREMAFEVRSANHVDGYAQIWDVLNLILYPVGGSININGEMYTAQLREIPSVYDRDSNKNYIFSFSAYIYKVANVNDPWLSELVSWSKGLGSAWTIYAGWPGNQRPCLIWQMTNQEVEQSTVGMYQVTKTFTGTVLGRTMDEQVYGATTIMQELGDAFKLCIDTAGNRYVTVQKPRMTIKPGDLNSATITVDLMRKTSRLNQEFYTAGSTTPAVPVAGVSTDSSSIN